MRGGRGTTRRSRPSAGASARGAGQLDPQPHGALRGRGRDLDPASGPVEGRDPRRVHGDPSAVDALAARGHPGTDSLKRVADRVGHVAGGVRPDSQEVVASASNDPHEVRDDLLDGLGGLVSGHRAPLPLECHAGLPRVVENVVGDLLLGSAVVLERTVDLTVHDHEARVVRAQGGGDLRRPDRLVGLAHPPRVEPDHVERAVALDDLLDLVAREVLVPLPGTRTGRYIVVVQTVANRSSTVPVLGTGPVRQREVGAHGEALLAEGVAAPVKDVTPQPRGLRGRREVRVVGVVHAEAVVVRRREDAVALSPVGAASGPLRGVELLTDEAPSLAVVPVLVLGVGALPVLGRVREPAEVVTVEGPGSSLSDGGVDAPVDDDAELHVAPRVRSRADLRLAGSDLVGVRGPSESARGLECGRARSSPALMTGSPRPSLPPRHAGAG